MRLGILFGGNSLEHEISIVTAYQLRGKLKDKYEIVMLYMDFNSTLYDASKVNIKSFKNDKIAKLKRTRFEFEGIKGKKIDCMILATHGENAEDGISAALCQFYNIPYVGAGVFSGSLCIDKWLTYSYLSSRNIPMLETTLYTYKDFLNGRKISEYPIIIKPNYGGSSLGIIVCENSDELENSLIEAFKYTKEVIIQKYYRNVKEYNLALYENDYSNLEEIKKKSDIFSFENKYNESFKQFHQKISNERLEEFKDIARKVYEYTKSSGIIRIDFFVVEDRIIVNEVNTTPGALSMYLFDDFLTIIDNLINQAILKKTNIYKKGSYLSSSEINK